MGSYGQCLYRRPSGVYVVRLCVPRPVQRAVGRRELHLSTGCANPALAKAHAGELQSRWRRCFEDLDRLNHDAVLKGAPELAGDPDSFVLLGWAAELFDVSPLELASTISATGGFGAIHIEAHEGWLVPDSVCTRIESQDDAEDKGVASTYAGYGVIVDWPDVYSVLALRNEAEAARFWVPGGTLHLSQARPVHLGLLWFKRSAVERARVCWAEAIDSGSRPAGHLASTVPPSALTVQPSAVQSPNAQQALTSFSSTLTAPVPTASNGHASQQSELLSSLVKEYLDLYSKVVPPSQRPIWRSDEASKHTTRLNRFVELLGDPCATELADRRKGETLLDRFVQGMTQLPTNADLRQAQRELGADCNAQDLIAWASRRETVQRMPPQTIKSYLSTVSAFMSWGIRRAHFSANFAKERMATLRIKDKSSQREKTNLFTPEELHLIFSADWFAKGTLTAKSGRINANWRPYKYWMPLMALHLGGRPNELAQLALTDFVEIEGIDCVAINDDASDKNVKNSNARRELPIPDALRFLGLLNYVAALRNAGHQRLFPELRRDVEKGYAKEVGKWFNEKYLGQQLRVERGTGKHLYSLRHHFATELRRTNCLQERIVELMGHERGEGIANSTYIKGSAKQDLLDALNGLAFGLPYVAPFDCKLGVLAVKAAESRKR